MLVFGYVMQDFLHFLGYLTAVVKLAVEPDEGKRHLLRRFLCTERINEDMLVLAIGFAHLPLHTVASDGMLEAFLRYTDEDGYIGSALIDRQWHIDYPQRESGETLVASRKQTFD